MSDEELDKLFRNATDEFSNGNAMSGWDDMASKLDHAERSAWYRSRAALIILVGLVTVGSLTFWFAKSIRTDNRETVKEIPTPFSQSTPVPTNPDGKIVDRNLNQTEEESPVVETIQDLTTGSLSATSKKKTEPQVTKKNIPSEYERSSRVTGNDETSITESSGESRNNYQEEIKSNKTNSNTPIVIPIAMDSIPMLKVENDAPENLQDSLDAKNPNKNTLGNNAGFSVKVSIAPDFSSTELFNQGQPGVDVGITVGYNINTRWSVYTGVILARKMYSSTNVDEPYNTGNGYSYEIEQLDGDCRILDIPLNAYYNFNPGRSLSFKAGLGFSSYIMLSEDYTYYVDKPYGSSEYYQRVENENNEWFKMMNVSFLIQKRLNDQFYLEVEPFVKIPMAGIGAGDISLYTIGGFVSLRYDFYKQKNKK